MCMAKSRNSPGATADDFDNHWLAAIVASSEDAIISKDLAGLIRTWNDGATRLFGYEAEEMMGRPVTLLIPAERQMEEAEIIGQVQRDERVQHYETVRRHKDGSMVDVSLTVSPIKDASGRIIGASKIARDISSRKQAEQAARASEERFRLLASHAPVGIFLSDRTGGCVFVNEHWCQMAGLTLAQAQGNGWAEALHPADRARVLAGWRAAVAAGQPSTSEFRFRRPDGSIVWIHGDAFQINDGGTQSYLGSCLDITGRKQAELPAAFLHDLSDKLGGLGTPRRIMEVTQAALGEYLDADRCFFFELTPDGTGGHVSRDWHRADLPDLAGSHRLADYGAPEFRALLARHRQQIPDLSTHPATAERHADHAALQVRSAATAAYHQEGRWLFTLAVTNRQLRTWSPEEMEVIENVVARIGPMIERARATEALRENERTYRAIGESIDYGIWVCDADGRNTYASDSFLKLVGITQEQCSNLGWTDLLHPDEIAGTTAAWQECARTGNFWEREHRFKGVDGRWHPILARGVPIRDDAGRIQRWVGINLDISGMKRIEWAIRQSESQLRLVTDHAPVFLAHCDRQHRFKFVNLPYARRYNLTREQVVGRHISELVGPAAYVTFKQHMDTALAGQRTEFEQEILYATLGLRWVHVIYEPEWNADGEVVGLLAVVVDISERKKVEWELERARDEALAASRAKDDFLAALSHELRTPLSPVLLMASDAASNPALPPDIREDFETIRANISLEARLIDDLLDLTHIARGKIQLEKHPVDIHAVLHDAVGNIRTEFAGKRLELELAATAHSPQIQGDAVRLQQVLWNLLRNAAKFTADDGHIGVSTQLPVGRNQLVVEISDNGIGLTADELAHVFEPFAQGEHATQPGPHRFGGLGLGLAIARNLVEMHAGRIYARSPGRDCGATFVVELPLAPVVREAPPKAPAAGDTPAGEISAVAVRRRVLLVEDHTATRVTVQKLLSRRGLDVEAADSVEAALTIATQQPFDFLVSDVGLPDGNGYQLIADLRKLHPRLQGIAMSGYGMEEDLQRSRTAGFSAHLVKPVTITALEQALAQLPQPSSCPPMASSSP